MDKPTSCSRSLDHCPEAERAADYAVKKTFAIMGINIDEPKEVRAFQEDLNFNRTLKTFARRSLYVISGTSIATIVAYLVKLNF